MHVQQDVAEHDLDAVLERVAGVLRPSVRVDAHGNAVLEGESTVPGEVVCMRVRLDDAGDTDVAPVGLLEVLLDREGRVDDDGVARSRIADEVGRTPERIVDELREDHGRARRYQRLPLFLLKCYVRRRHASIATATTTSTPMRPTTPARARFWDGLFSAGRIVKPTGQATTPPSG